MVLIGPYMIFYDRMWAIYNHVRSIHEQIRCVFDDMVDIRLYVNH